MVRLTNSDFHEGLHIVEDAQSGLKGAIAIHSTALGPAAGGCRFWCYADQADLVADALRLARGMSYKNALAGLPFGGGKAVLQRPQEPFDRETLFRNFGEAVAKLDGLYVTAEDVGTSTADMHAVRERTSHVSGLSANGDRAGGDPSPWTALGVFESMKMAANWLGFDLAGATVAVQGVGNVGEALCHLLHHEGAQLIVADIDPQRASKVARTIGARVASVEDIALSDVDIFSPCALGGILNEQSIPRLKAALVCGAANNQLLTDVDGERLRAHGIAYAPDYVVNAGGIICVAAEYLGESAQSVECRVKQIAPRLIDILEQAQLSSVASNLFADERARQTIACGHRAVA